MNRTQISLTAEQQRFLEDLSRQTGESVSAIIRMAVDRLRSEEETPNRRVARLFGAFEADRHDVSVNHDKILWGAPPDVAAERLPTRKPTRGGRRA